MIIGGGVQAREQEDEVSAEGLDDGRRRERREESRGGGPRRLNTHARTHAHTSAMVLGEGAMSLCGVLFGGPLGWVF